MSTPSPRLTQRPAWQALAVHYDAIKDQHLRTLFAGDVILEAANRCDPTVVPDEVEMTTRHGAARPHVGFDQTVFVKERH